MVQCGSGRSHRSRLTYLVAGFGVADRTIGGSHKSNAGHALLCGLDWSGYTLGRHVLSQLFQGWCIHFDRAI